MKELSIEKKAKAYDEALKRAMRLYEQGTITESLSYVFPELKESEDERIKEAIIATIHLYYGEPLEDEAKEMIYWLEKQGEKDKLIKELGEYKVKYTQEILSQQLEKQAEQKPAWSDENEVKINRIVACLENLNVADNDILLKDVDWLKSLKERYVWKPSDEQINLLEELAEDNNQRYFYTILRSLCEQLKKLKEE